MKNRVLFFLFIVILPAAAILTLAHSSAWARGCPQNEPDRDKDGVPDKDDLYPDDPTRWSDDQACGKQAPLMKLYFIPFQSETPGPVTTKTIELNSETALWVYKNEGIVEKFKEIFDRPGKEFEPERTELLKRKVRLKIELPEEGVTYFVDAEGTALRAGELFVMSEEQLEDLTDAIDDIRAVLDLNVQQEWKDHLR